MKFSNSSVLLAMKLFYIMIIYALLEPHVTILEWKDTQLKFPWNVTILLGSGFALARACEVTLFSF